MSRAVLQHTYRQQAVIYALKARTLFSLCMLFSKRQDATAYATPEADIVAANTVLTTMTPPSLDMRAVLLQTFEMWGILREGNPANIQPCSIYNGYTVFADMFAHTCSHI